MEGLEFKDMLGAVIIIKHYFGLAEGSSRNITTV